MGCIYEILSFDEDSGKCSLFEDGEGPMGCDEDGFCVCLDDEDPAYTCESYESDYTCPECGCDLNVEDCDCEEEW